ncbi:SGNH/GDSL hydrolase family protein [Streptomyces radicis]|uniref:SGNH/GDSL hydrolase family protein n=1 Tax=Streptomyces radicis TaxID=1750517 RepID=A0A3A9VTM5_9ACTN|nr:SGNH/GDSL hydrolase family protein [Streptomyces radicis]RKN03523.1 SGNH/GDSL hydrolase family protein [Streptomyces radicis]RKN20331.1 SGNH/GDSL hydrolase family protein [Streptomyces radicis]
MRPPKLLTVLSALVLSVLMALVGTGSAQAAGPAYVALGDSYSSGNGAGNYIDASGNCHRSNNAYPALWAAANAPSSFSFVACSGAVTSDVTGSQLSSLNASTGLVSISIGGNDAGFANVMTTCVTGSDSTCLNRIATAESFITGTLPGRLNSVYSAIDSRAPNAHVVVLGYPRMYIEPSNWCIGLSQTKREAINDASDLLNSVISARASAHGFAFGDVAARFAGHELCSGDNWLHDVRLPTWEAYHPTALGHSGGYLPALNAVD